MIKLINDVLSILPLRKSQPQIELYSSELENESFIAKEFFEDDDDDWDDDDDDDDDD